MLPNYRVRFTTGHDGRVRAGDVVTADFPGELGQLPELLPVGTYVISIESLAEGREVHWTRWPPAFRPGTRNVTTGRVVT